MDIKRFRQLTNNAKLIRNELQDIIDSMGGRVHFRPGADGISMVSLLAKSPQMGLSRIRNIKRLKDNFDQLFDKHCRQVAPKRPTPEKELQSYLISEAYRHPMRILPFDDLGFTFVTDEIPVYLTNGNKVVCDLLAVKKLKTGYTPVLIELKSSREMKRLIDQVRSYSPVIDSNPDKFSELFTALLGDRTDLVGPCEKWIVWPAIRDRGDPRENDFNSLGIGMITYTKNKKPFRFWTSRIHG